MTIRPVTIRRGCAMLACLLVACGPSENARSPVAEGEVLGIQGPVDVDAAMLADLFAQAPIDPVGSYEHDECDDEVECDLETALVAPPEPPADLVGTTEGAQALDQTPTLTASWQALTSADYGGVPPDPQIAVSDTHIVMTLTRWIAFYNKGGALLQSTSSPTFFSPLGLDDGTNEGIDIYSDMRVIYDDYRKRFWVCALARSNFTNASPQLPPDRRRSLVTVAVSRTNDPNDGWFMYWWDAAIHWGRTDSDIYEPGDVADYTVIGVGPDGFHEVNKIGNAAIGNNSRYWKISIADADAMAAGQPGANVGGWQYWNLTNPDGSAATLIQPAVHHGITARSYYVSRAGTSDLVVWALTGFLTPNQQLRRVSVPLPTWSSPLNAPQLGSSDLIRMTNLGTAPLKAVFRWPYLWACCQDARTFGGTLRTAVRYVRLQVAFFPDVQANPNSGFISRTFGGNSAEDPPESEVYYGWPAMEVNKDYDAVLVYTRSGSTIYPETRYSTYLAAEPDIRPSRVLRAGDAPYDVGTADTLRWGDLAGASVDPYDQTGVWITHQYARSSGGSNNWGIWVGKVFGLTYLDWRWPSVVLDGVDVGGGTFEFSGTFSNGGDADAPRANVSVEVVHDDRATVVGSFELPALTAGASTSFRQTMPLPDGIASGDHLLRLRVMSDGTEEYSQDNNDAVVPLPVP